MEQLGDILQAKEPKNNILTIKLDKPLDKPVKKPHKKMPRNAEGKPLKKNGEVSCHKPLNQKCLDGLKLYRERKLQMKKTPPPIEEKEDESDADEVDEFIIEEIEMKKAEPKIIEKEIVKEVVKETPDPKVLYENQLLKQKNEKLKESLHINQYLNRLSHLSQNTMVRF